MKFSSSDSYKNLKISFSLIYRATTLQWSLKIFTISVLTVPTVIRYFEFSLCIKFLGRPLVTIFPIKFLNASPALLELSYCYLSMLLFNAVVNEISMESAVVSSNKLICAHISNNAAESLELSKNWMINLSNWDKNLTCYYFDDIKEVMVLDSFLFFMSVDIFFGIEICAIRVLFK